MSRYIPVREPAEELPDRVHVEVGDVLQVAASGARVDRGSAVAVLGILQEAVLGTDGRVLSPMGGPNTVLLRAEQPGEADVALVTGDAWRSPQTRTVTVVVEPGQ